MSPTDISYIAGLLDGEGCIQIRKGKSSGWSCYISISNTNRECLEFVQLRFGGHIYGSPKKNSNYIVYQWNIRSLKAMEFAKAVKPFSIIKRKQLETFLRVERTFTGASRLSPNHADLRLSCASRLLMLRSCHGQG